MTGRVIQGLFLGGQPKLAAVQPRTAPLPPIQARTMTRPPGPPTTPFAVRAPGPPAAAFALRAPGPRAPAFSGHPPAAPVFASRQEIVQRHGAGGAFAVDAGPLGLVSTGGRPLPEAVRGKMEAALGADFSGVRVHVGPQAERIGAIAFTVGSDIYFAPGRYQPDTIHGQQLLGHELAHVVQQRAGRVRNPLGGGLAVVQDHALEAEADRMGQRAAMHRAAQAKLAPRAAQPSGPVRISPPVSAGTGSFRLSAGAGGREIGSVMVHARDRGAVEVTDLGVDAAQRGNGVGRMLVAAAARTGLQSGRSKVTLAAQDRGSGHLTHWYREMGFTQTGVNRFGYPKLEAPIGRVLAGAAQRQTTDAVRVPARVPIQRRTLQRMEEKHIRITNDLVTIPAHNNWGSRPATNASGQQSHRTSYSSFQEEIRVSVHRKHPDKAVKRLKKLFKSYNFLRGIGNSRANLLKAIQENLVLLDQPRADDKETRELLGQVITNALTIRNMVPKSVGKGSRGYHDEGGTIKALRVYEKNLEENGTLPTDGNDNELRILLWRLLDYQEKPKDEKEVIDIVWNHLRTMQSSFPACCMYLRKNNLLLIPFLRKNRGFEGAPLVGIDDEILAEVEKFIHGNWV